MNENRIENICALTPAQEGIYYQSRRSPDAALYDIGYVFRLSADTSLPLMEKALRLLPRRHAVLRSAFAFTPSSGKVKQVILKDRAPEILYRRIPSPFSAAALRTEIEADKNKGMDPQKDPLLRTTFVVFSDAAFLLLRIHHLIIDGWSASVLLEDLGRYYGSLAAGGEEEALRRKIDLEAREEPPFSAFAAELRRRDISRAREHWKALLRGLRPAPLFGRQWEPSAQFDHQRKEFSVPDSLSRAIRTFSAGEGVSVNTVTELAFALTLCKYSGGGDAVFNKVISGRSAGGAKYLRTVGPFINTVPLRLRKNAGPRALLKALSAQGADAEEYGFLPLSEVYRDSGLSAADTDALFSFGNYYTGEQSAGDAAPLRLVSQSELTEFPLTVNVVQSDGKYRFIATYDGSVYSGEEIDLFFHGLLSVLGRLIALPPDADDDSARVAAITAPSDEELHDLLARAAGPVLPLPKDVGIYGLFAQRVEASPDAPALFFKNQTFSYRALKVEADFWAGRLSAAGLAAGQVVAVYLHRSPLLVFLQLAALRLGAVFLPVDRQYPPQRAGFVCRDSGAALLITDGDAQALDIPTFTPEALRTLPAAKTEAAVGEIAYMIYTSGSTGEPKGCMLRTAGLVNFCFHNNTLDYLRKNAYTVFACVNNAAFDYFIAETLLPLTNGFAVVLCDEEESLRAARFTALVRARGINVLMTTPTRLSLFFAEGTDVEALAELQLICSSGEPLSPALRRRIAEAAPEAKLLNPLGPSECTVWVTDGETEGDAVLIGRPITNARCYLLDENLTPVPVGAPGELCIAGESVGAGYLRRDDLNREKFTDDPFGEGRLFRTGDLCRRRADGRLEYIGRRDLQLKVNGLRIEPGEIETALCRVPGVRGAAVVLKRDPDRLFAFYTGETLSDAVFTAALRRTLPAYMLPAGFIRISDFPLTANGKTDRAALLSLVPTSPAPSEQKQTAPPRSEEEALACRLFKKALGSEDVGPDDDFFALGGTSMTMLSLLSAPGLGDVSVAAFLADPTPAALALALAQRDVLPDSRLLEPLYVPDRASRAWVLFSYAGGSAAAYATLVSEARTRKSPLALYYVDWLPASAYPAAEKEIRRLCEKTHVCFYSHCAGAATAMRLIDRLNTDSDRPVRGYLAGASLPPLKAAAGKNRWTHATDEAIVRYLEKGGFQGDLLAGEALSAILRDFRAHTAEFGRYFAEKTAKTPCRTSVLLGTGDPFTRPHAAAPALWSRAVSDFDRVFLFDTPSHYFQSEKAGDLLELLSALFTDN